MALQDVGNIDANSATSYVASSAGIVISGATLLEVISVGVGIILGIVSIIGVVLTYRSVAERNKAQRDLALMQQEMVSMKQKQRKSESD